MQIQRKKTEAAKSFSLSEEVTLTWTHVSCTRALAEIPINAHNLTIFFSGVIQHQEYHILLVLEPR